MTGEEMERAIEFLLQSQANFETRLAAFEAQQRHTDEQIAETNAQIGETNRQLQTYAETQSEFIGIMSRNVDALTTAQAQTDARLNKLIGLFEQHIVAGH
jgi:chromosome segregation ATPase